MHAEICMLIPSACRWHRPLHCSPPLKGPWPQPLRSCLQFYPHVFTLRSGISHSSWSRLPFLPPLLCVHQVSPSHLERDSASWVPLWGGHQGGLDPGTTSVQGSPSFGDTRQQSEGPL